METVRITPLPAIIYTLILTKARCDSVANLHLTILHSSTASETAAACYHYLWHGTDYTTSGVYTYTTPNAVNCDSIISLHLTVNNAATSNQTLTACDSYIWNGSTYTTSGIIAITPVRLPAAIQPLSCHLTINHPPAAPSISVTVQTDCATPTGTIVVNSPDPNLTYTIDNGLFLCQ